MPAGVGRATFARRDRRDVTGRFRNDGGTAGQGGFIRRWPKPLCSVLANIAVALFLSLPSPSLFAQDYQPMQPITVGWYQAPPLMISTMILGTIAAVFATRMYVVIRQIESAPI